MREHARMQSHTPTHSDIKGFISLQGNELDWQSSDPRFPIFHIISESYDRLEEM